MDLKRIIAGVLAITITAGMVSLPVNENGIKFSSAISASAEESSDGFEYTVLDDGTVEITKYTGTDVNVTIPDTIDGKKVTSIGESAFTGRSSLTSITIPDSVTSIGAWAFENCTSLTSITIPDSVTSIGNDAFYGCSRLTSVTIPNSVTSIGGGAFSWCSSLTSITIPDSVTSIGNSAFWCCSSLKSITIPDGVTSIGDGAFDGCSSLTDINVGKNNINYCSVDGILFNKNKTQIIQYPARKTSKSYIIPDSVTSIIDNAFEDCLDLTNITIPDSVTSIGDDVFDGCSSLTDINVGENNINYCSVDGILFKLFNKNITQLIQYPAGKKLDSYTIPDGVTSIGEGAFCQCKDLESITIPDSVTSIGDWAFKDCTSLTSITIPDSVTSIGDGAFYYCPSLTNITIPNGVTSIGKSTFYLCSLTSITIPDSVTSIESWAFGHCSNLTNITIPDGVTSIGEYAFYNCSGLKYVYYKGTEDQWNKISIEDENDYLKNAKIYFNYDPNHKHIFSEWTVTKPATCTEDGEKVRTCSVYNEEEKQIIKATGHKMTAVKAKEATCTEEGNVAYWTCANEKDVYYKDAEATEKFASLEEVIIPKKDHKYSTEWTIDKEPTATEPGSKSHHCTVCDEKTDVTEIPAHEHVFSELTVTKLATCTEDGEEEGVCSVCGETIKKVIPASNTVEKWTITKPATCTEDGEEEGVCSVCGEAIKRVIPASHTVDEWTVIKAETCTEDGEKEGVCSVCGETIKESIPATGHKYSEEWTVTKPATCTEDGEKEGVCSVCGETIKGSIPATGHKYSEEWTIDKEPTATEPGSKSHHCTVCGEKTDVTEIPAKGNGGGNSNSGGNSGGTSGGSGNNGGSSGGSGNNGGNSSSSGNSDGSTSVSNNTNVPPLQGGSTNQLDANTQTKKSLSKAKVAGLVSKSYTGKQIKPKINVVVDGKNLKAGTDYDVKYGKNKSVGKGTVTIIGKGAYSGKIIKAFKINPRKTSAKLKSTTGKITVSLKKIKEAKKYQIQYATNKKFKGAKKITTTAVKKSFKAKSGKTYYVRVRSVNGKYVSGWSAVKKIKVK